MKVTYKRQSEDFVPFADCEGQLLSVALLLGYERTDVYPMYKEADHERSRRSHKMLSEMARTNVQRW